MKITAEQLARINTNRNEPLIAAARSNDTDAAHDTNLHFTLTRLGIDMGVLNYLIDQRLLRLANLGLVPTRSFLDPDPHPITALAPTDRLLGYQIAYIDGIGIGWTAKTFALDGIPASVRIEKPITMDDYDAWTRERKR